MTAYRADFDAWLADKAVQAGATLVCSTTATGLLRDSTGRICGVTTDRPDGDVLAEVVIAGDGVNSFLAKSAGLYDSFDPHNFTVGVKEVLRLPREVIDERCRLSGDEGLDIEIMGCTRGSRWRLPLHQPRHGRGRHRRAGHGTGGGQVRPETLLGGSRTTPLSLRSSPGAAGRVQRPHHPGGRVRRHAR